MTNSPNNGQRRQCWPATIVMPLLTQREEWLDKALRSALDQTVECEVLVVTAPKTPPGNLELLARLAGEHDNLRFRCREKGQNFAGAINSGIRLASSDRVGLLFSDDWLRPHALELCLPRQADIVSTAATIFDMDGRTRVGQRKVTETGFNARQTLERKAAYLSHFYLFRRTALLDIGGVDETVGLSGADDFDMIWTLLENNASVSIVEESLYCFRDHNETRLTLRSREEQTRDITLILKKHGIPESELDQLVALHAKWFGVPIQEVLRARETPVPD